MIGGFVFYQQRPVGDVVLSCHLHGRLDGRKLLGLGSLKPFGIMQRGLANRLVERHGATELMKPDFPIGGDVGKARLCGTGAQGLSESAYGVCVIVSSRALDRHDYKPSRDWFGSNRLGESRGVRIFHIWKGKFREVY